MKPFPALDMEYDVIVVGSGAAGLATAVIADELGLNTIVLEKSELLGGGTCYSYGLIWAGANHVAADAGYDDPREHVEQYLRFLAGGQADEKRLRALLEGTPSALDLLRRCGLPLSVVRGLTDHHYDHAPGSTAEGRTLETSLIRGADLGKWQHKVVTPPVAAYRLTAEELVSRGGMNAAGEASRARLREEEDVRGLGVGLICQLLMLLIRRRVPVHTGAAVERLMTMAGRVEGVGLTDGRLLRARRGVVLATGGYDSNAQLAKRFEGLPNARSMFPRSLTGDGFVMATEVGASTAVVHHNQQLFLGFDIPLGDGEETAFQLAGIVELCSPHTMVVNASGRRFANEAFFQDVAPLLRHFDGQRRTYANLPCYLIFDSQYARRFSFAGRPVGAPIPEWVRSTTTLEDLATTLSVDAEGLRETATRMNSFAEQGLDHDFGRGREMWRLGKADAAHPSRLGTIEVPPFYGLELHPSVVSSAGLDVDAAARVRHVRGHVIDGLFAVGNAAVHSEFGMGYQAGLTLASGMCFGYLAVAQMARSEGNEQR